MPDAVLYRALRDIQTTIQGLGLGGVSSANVVLEKVASDRNQSLPAILIAPLEEELPRDAGLNDRDDVTYNIVVAIVSNDNQDQAANFEQELNWRENCRRAFHRKRLAPLTTESVICFVKPLAVAHPEAWSANLFLSLLLVQCVCREPRTPAN